MNANIYEPAVEAAAPYPMDFVTVITRVTEPGSVRVYQCHACEKVDFRPQD